jgi:hypothetical protein
MVDAHDHRGGATCLGGSLKAQQLRQLGDVGGDAPGLVAGELAPRQRLPAHGEKMLAYKAEQRSRHGGNDEAA